VTTARQRKKYRQWKISRGIPRKAQRSDYIPKFLRTVVFAADRYQCAHCGYGEGLQVDHVFPWSLGGLTVFFNLVTLCAECNRAKSNYWQFRRSRNVVYVPFAGYNVPGRAAAILDSERHRRRNPLRLWRAAWAL
jgi:5-methylcytosine-specific restriction endonuclease McrA